MTASKEQLQALLERVEKAEGPDREIDARLHVSLLTPVPQPDDLRYYRLPASNLDYDRCEPGTFWLKQRSGQSLHTAPRYTASIDAAVALVEKVLPGWGWSTGFPLGNVGFWASVWREGFHMGDDGQYFVDGVSREKYRVRTSYKPTPALALCAALLRALISRAE